MSLWRRRTSTADLRYPELMVRRLVPPDHFEATVALYEQVTGRECDLRFDYERAGLRLAAVGAVLIVAGDAAALDPFRATDYTVVVADLDEQIGPLQSNGAEILDGPQAVPTGRNMLVRLPDGSRAEYVEHRPQPGESESSGTGTGTDAGTGVVTPMNVESIGVVSSPRTDPSDTTGWGDVVARIELVKALGTESLTGLDGFTHAEVVFWFDRVQRRESYAGLSRARGRDDMPPIGVFAARGPNRPNPIGVSVCRIVEVGDTWLSVRGLDAVDGTPVLDVKPVQVRLLPTDVAEPEWSERLMRDYYVR